MLRIERLRHDIVTLGELAAAAQQRQGDVLNLALTWWNQLPDAGQLREHLEPLLRPSSRTESGWTGAVPATLLPPGIPLAPEPVTLQDLVLIGVDGSQIYPDRHALTLYYLIQIGGVIFRYNGQAPGVHVKEWLHYTDEELFDAHGYLIGSDLLGMERMIKEMAVMAELADGERRVHPGNPVIGLTDGPLLWPYADRGRTTEEKLRGYLDALGAAQRSGGIPVGYVDRPGGRPLLEMLWASRLTQEDLVERWQDNPLRPLDDEKLMLHVLGPGERTPWFTRPTATNARHAGAGQEIWFCYQRLDADASAHVDRRTVARLEVPAWAVVDDAALGQVHAALLHQARVLNGYPYVLARAHEEALVTTQDKTALEQSIQRELFGARIFAEASDKAQQKSLLSHK